MSTHSGSTSCLTPQDPSVDVSRVVWLAPLLLPPILEAAPDSPSSMATSLTIITNFCEKRENDPVFNVSPNTPFSPLDVQTAVDALVAGTDVSFTSAIVQHLLILFRIPHDEWQRSHKQSALLADNIDDFVEQPVPLLIATAAARLLDTVLPAFLALDDVSAFDDSIHSAITRLLRYHFPWLCTHLVDNLKCRFGSEYILAILAPWCLEATSIEPMGAVALEVWGRMARSGGHGCVIVLLVVIGLLEMSGELLEVHEAHLVAEYFNKWVTTILAKTDDKNEFPKIEDIWEVSLPDLACQTPLTYSEDWDLLTIGLAKQKTYIDCLPLGQPIHPHSDGILEVDAAEILNILYSRARIRKILKENPDSQLIELPKTGVRLGIPIPSKLRPWGGSFVNVRDIHKLLEVWNLSVLDIREGPSRGPTLRRARVWQPARTSQMLNALEHGRGKVVALLCEGQHPFVDELLKREMPKLLVVRGGRAAMVAECEQAPPNLRAQLLSYPTTPLSPVINVLASQDWGAMRKEALEKFTDFFKRQVPKASEQNPLLAAEAPNFVVSLPGPSPAPFPFLLSPESEKDEHSSKTSGGDLDHSDDDEELAALEADIEAEAVARLQAKIVEQS